MGQKLISTYKDYLDANFSLPNVKALILQVLDMADDINSEMPASATGKYHPIADLGPGGLVRHSIMVTEVCKVLIRSLPEYDDVLEKETILAACLLHDICKYKDDPELLRKELRTDFNHPVLGAQLIKKAGEEIKEIPLSVKVAELVMTHHSRWNKKNTRVGEGVEINIKDDELDELPLPNTFAQRIVSFSDLIAANSELPELMIKFREEAIKEVFNR